MVRKTIIIAVLSCILEVTCFNRTFHLQELTNSSMNYMMEVYLEELGTEQVVNLSLNVPNGTVLRMISGENLEYIKEEHFEDTRLTGNGSYTQMSEIHGEVYIQRENDSKGMIYHVKEKEGPTYVFYSDNSTNACRDIYKIAVMFLEIDCSYSGDAGVCNGHGRCQEITTMSKFSCVCCEGYAGRYCEESTFRSMIKETRNDSVSNECIGKCSAEDNCSRGGVFATMSGIHFNNCTQIQRLKSQKIPDLTICKSDVCLHGKCRNQHGKKLCFCESGYFGEHCQYKHDECFSNPCKNGGSCLVYDGGHRCKCTIGFYGRNCSIKVNLCEPNPCKQNTRCYDIGDEYFCDCPRGLAGKHCDRNINDCDPNPCLRRGNCRDMIGGYRCLCKDGTAGNKCEFFIDIFAPPLESQVSGVIRGNHLHNLYTVAGVLTGIFLLVLIIFVSCYCRANNFCGSFFPCCNRLGSKFRRISSTSSDEIFRINKPNLSLDALLDVMSPRRQDLCTDRGEPLLVKEV